jgi:membrane fusion protein, heavy metal efflux system
MFWKLTIAVLAIAGVGGAIYISGVTKSEVLGTLKSLHASTTPLETTATPRLSFHDAKEAFDGTITIDKEQREAIGLRTAVVAPQTQPIELELTGRTAYDPDTLTKIRPRFDTLVEKVHASLGKKIKKGDPLVELFSTDLAQAKSDFQTKYVQWQHDLRLLKAREKLHKEGAVSTQQLVDTQNDEKKSHLDNVLARDKLKVLKVPDEEIEPLLAGLSDEASTITKFGKVEDKAKMTLLSPTDGIVIEREVVPGNFYESTSVLMVIAPLDHLWVWVNVYELDQDKVRNGQTMEIQFPFLEQTIQGKVQYIANEVSKDTRAVKIRATIPNPGTRLKSDMLVKAMLEIPPVPGQTVIPRMAMVATNGRDYVFVRKPDAPDADQAKDKSKGKGKGKDVYRFERREIHVAQENGDRVVVRSGLKAGEEVATNGSLILSQLYEDLRVVDTGQPVP